MTDESAHDREPVTANGESPVKITERCLRCLDFGIRRFEP